MPQGKAFSLNPWPWRTPSILKDSSISHRVTLTSGHWQVLHAIARISTRPDIIVNELSCGIRPADEPWDLWPIHRMGELLEWGYVQIITSDSISEIQTHLRDSCADVRLLRPLPSIGNLDLTLDGAQLMTKSPLRTLEVQFSHVEWLATHSTLKCNYALQREVVTRHLYRLPESFTFLSGPKELKPWRQRWYLPKRGGTQFCAKIKIGEEDQLIIGGGHHPSVNPVDFENSEGDHPASLGDKILEKVYDGIVTAPTIYGMEMADLAGFTDNSSANRVIDELVLLVSDGVLQIVSEDVLRKIRTRVSDTMEHIPWRTEVGQVDFTLRGAREFISRTARTYGSNWTSIWPNVNPVLTHYRLFAADKRSLEDYLNWLADSGSEPIERRETMSPCGPYLVTWYQSVIKDGYSVEVATPY